MDWARILAYVTGTVDQELLARNEYLAAENRILKAQLKGRLKLSDAERAMLGAGTGAQAHDHLAGLHSHPPGSFGGDLLFHRGDTDPARAGDLLRAVFHPS
jgi:hypothetical protein